MKKRCLSILLAMCMVLTLLPATALAADSDFTIENGVLTKYNGPGGVVTIPDSVTSIGQSAFEFCTDLTSVTIPNSVTSIGSFAFRGCTGLTSVTIPNSVTSIGTDALEGCTGLTSITIPDSVTDIGYYAFADCTSLTAINVDPGNSIYTSIEGALFSKDKTTLVAYPSGKQGAYTIPDSVASIGTCAFYGCMSLTGVTIPNSVTDIGLDAFGSCKNLTQVNLSDSLTYIGSSAFEGCISISSINIGGNGCTIGDWAFAGCVGLTSVTLSTGVTKIGNQAFNGCTNLLTVMIGDSVSSVGQMAFINCSVLTNINVSVNNAFLSTEDGVLFDKNKELLIVYPAGSSRSIYDIPSGVTKLADSAFEDCINLARVSFPNTLKTIGQCAFQGCSGLRSISLPDSIQSISYNAFADCTSLENAEIKSGVTEMGRGIFSGCTSLTAFTFPNTLVYVPPEMFEGCSNLSGVVLHDGIIAIYEYAFSGCISLKHIDLNEGITSLGNYAFQNCSSLEDIVIPKSITEIQYGAFDSCSSITSFSIPSNMQIISERTFYDCTNLKDLYIPKSITSIDRFAFDGCNGLTDIYYSGSVEQWESISIGIYNTYLTGATIHYNSTGPDDVGPDNMNPVCFLSGWDAVTRTVKFGDEEITPDTYTVADSVDVSSIDRLLNKYVLVTMEQGDSSLEYTITDIQPVESKIGTVSATGEHSLTIDGTTYPVREDYVLAAYDGEEVLYHTYNGTIMGFDVLKAKTGMLEAWDATTGKATIDGKTYVTNYLSDLSLMSNADNVIGKKIEFSVVDSFDYYPALSFSFCPGFYFSSNAPTNSIERGSTFDLYVGYYFDDGSLDSKSKEFVSVVSDNKIVEIVPDGWSDKYGQHYTAKANSAGNATFTVTNSRNNDAASLNLYVIEKEYGYNFDNVPKLTYEEGKVTNFYNHNGLVVDEFAYTPHKNASGEIDYYVVTMNVYNTLDLYGAVTAYNADGNPTGFYLIDKKEVFQSNLTNTYNELLLEIGDLFYLIGNEKFYSGESISKKTVVTINVPVGGYLEISNSIYSDVALIANITGLLIDGLKSAKGIFDSSSELDGLISQKTAIIHDVISKDFVGDKINSAIKSVALNDFKNANWNLENYGECLQAFLNHLSDLGINLMDSISSSIFTLTGFRNISESVLMKIVPTGDLINFLYKVMGIGDQAITWITFQKSADFAKGIYIYAPSTGKSYSSNGISVVPASSAVESNVVLHSYLVVDETEIPSNTFNGDAETYSITMYKDGKETQPNTTITVRIPLSEKFKGLDKSVIKVYRHNDDGTTTNMNATIVDGYAIFETNHLSYYSVVAEANLPNPVTYTVVFHPNGGALSGYSALTTSTEGKLSSLPTATRSDYTFDGWFTSASGGNKITTDYVFISDTTVYAHWTKNSGGSSGGSSSSGSSSSGSSTYPPTVSKPSEGGGAATVSPSNPKQGDTVTVTPKPDEGYEVDKITVTGPDGKTVEVKRNPDGTYTFIQPNGKVKIEVTYKLIEGSWSNPFTDVSEGDWYYAAVRFVQENGLMNGYGEGRFGPNDNLSRAQFAQILFNREGRPVVNYLMQFGDVTGEAWYAEAVRWAASQGIVSGYGNGMFGPNDPITREQLAVMLWRHYGSPAATNKELHFNDANEISGFALEAMRWAVEHGIVNGYGDGRLGPKGQATRAQVAQMLKNCLDR